MLLIKALAALAFVAVEKAAATIFYAGVAESSGEFGVWSMCTPCSIISEFLPWMSFMHQRENRVKISEGY